MKSRGEPSLKRCQENVSSELIMVAESALGEQSLSPRVSLPWIIFNELFILPADSLL